MQPGAWWVAAARWGLWLYLSFINVVNVVDGGVKGDEEKFANTDGRMDGGWMVDGWLAGGGAWWLKHPVAQVCTCLLAFRLDNYSEQRVVNGHAPSMPACSGSV